MSHVLLILLLASGLVAFLFALHEISLLVLCFVCRPRVPEAAEPSTWPPLTVQIPFFNDPAVASRSVEAALALEYPGELEIQLLDDSTDVTTKLLERTAAGRGAQGHARLIHRASRDGYKAGALAGGLALAKGELIAILDSDFLPPADFLLRLVPLLLTTERTAMVQARWEFLNREENWITRSVAIGMENHFALEQEARFRGGLWCNFNGSGGIWRRSAIEEAGGWSSDTLTEDLDLSYRAQLKGLDFAFALEVPVPCELPPRIATFLDQQRRWCRGCTQTARKLARSIVRAKVPFGRRLFALLHLFGFSALPALLLNALLWLPAAVWGGPAFGWVSRANAAFLGVSSTAVLLSYGASQRLLHADWLRRLLHLPGLLLIGSGLTLSGAAAWFAGILGGRAAFVRTEKFAGSSSSRPQAAGWSSVFLHGAFGLYLFLSSWYSILIEHYWMTPLLVVQGGASLFVSLVEVRELAAPRLLPLSEGGVQK